uniref:Envelope glycoprotein n=1 Tax=Strigops habroptila TaxID=2489341 RepID=A0A672TJV2_STRHB
LYVNVITLSVAGIVTHTFEKDYLIKSVVNHTSISNCWVCGTADQFNSPLLGIPLSNWTDLNPYSMLNTSSICKTENVALEKVPFVLTLVNTSLLYINFNALNTWNLGTLDKASGNGSNIALLLEPRSDPNSPGNYTHGTRAQPWADYLYGRSTTNVTMTVNAACNLPDGYWWLCGDSHARKQLPKNWTGECTMGILAPLLQVYNHNDFQGILRGTWKRIRAKSSTWSNPLTRYNTGFHSFVRALHPGLRVVQLERAIINISAEMEIIASNTADAILGLKQEIDSLKKVVLQNRMALDIITAQMGGVCTLVNESCCTYVDHSQRILTDVQEIWNHAKILHEISKDEGLSWLDKLLSGWGITAWLQSIVKTGLFILSIFFCILLVLPCLITCLQSMMQNMIHRIMVVEKQKRGDVGQDNFGLTEFGLDDRALCP